jgi:uncharacterized protein YndB with AHSA1/START domain
MRTTMDTSVATQVYRVYIKATPQAIWDAITTPEWTERYGVGGRAEYELRQGGAYRVPTTEAMRKAGARMGLSVPDVMVDGEVIELDPPRRLVQTFRMLMDEATAAEGFTRLTWEIDELPDGVSKLTVVHELEGKPQLAALSAGERESEGAGGGWSYVLSDLKTLLETGSSMGSSMAPSTGPDHR